MHALWRSVISFSSGVVVLVLKIQRVLSQYDMLSLWCVECIVNIVERSVMSFLQVLWFGYQLSEISLLYDMFFWCLLWMVYVHCRKVSSAFFAYFGLVLNLHCIFLKYDDLLVWCLKWSYIVVKCHHVSPLVLFSVLWSPFFYGVWKTYYIVEKCHQFFFRCFNLVRNLQRNALLGKTSWVYLSGFL